MTVICERVYTGGGGFGGKTNFGANNERNVYS